VSSHTYFVSLATTPLFSTATAVRCVSYGRCGVSRCDVWCSCGSGDRIARRRVPLWCARWRAPRGCRWSGCGCSCGSGSGSGSGSGARVPSCHFPAAVVFCARQDARVLRYAVAGGGDPDRRGRCHSEPCWPAPLERATWTGDEANAGRRGACAAVCVAVAVRRPCAAAPR
jgi:hypothetical protein